MMSSAPPAVQLEGISKSFGPQRAVDNLSLTVPAGSVYGFIGPNGSGKTTTLRMILHIILPDSGRVEVLGESGTRAANNRIGYLPEERGLYKKQTVRHLLTYFGTLKGLPAHTASAAALSWLQKMDLLKWADKKIETLSKGMSQKVQFIGSVIANPHLLILDEPFSGLDPVNREVLLAAILEQRNRGTTVIFSTHDMATAESMCDFIFMIYQGKKVLDGTLGSVQAQYGADTIRLRTQGGASLLASIPGVDLVRDLGQEQEIRFAGPPQQLLEQLVPRTRISLFEVTQPSLHDIFVRIASPKPPALPNPTDHV